ncbi:hypothetical protein ZWY2020_059276 [Hordeum vulgare]|nr:hypothetical protein ZWY2020_059276 [Hordeum vulgare]
MCERACAFSSSDGLKTRRPSVQRKRKRKRKRKGKEEASFFLETKPGNAGETPETPFLPPSSLAPGDPRRLFRSLPVASAEVDSSASSEMDRRRGPCQVHDPRYRVQPGSPPPAGGGAGASGALQASCIASSMTTSKNSLKTVHQQLRMQLSRALARMCNTSLLDRRVLDECLCEISEALVAADFLPETVTELQVKVKKAMDPTGSSSHHSIHQVVYKEICKLIDSGRKPSFVPKKGKPCIVLVIGLEDSGKTTSCAKFAYYHKQKDINHLWFVRIQGKQFT